MTGYTPGLWVQSVREDMDVYAKGLRAGDIITQIDGQDVRDSETVKAIMRKRAPAIWWSSLWSSRVFPAR